jgi:hypothetical protein
MSSGMAHCLFYSYANACFGSDTSQAPIVCRLYSHRIGPAVPTSIDRKNFGRRSQLSIQHETDGSRCVLISCTRACGRSTFP